MQPFKNVNHYFLSVLFRFNLQSTRVYEEYFFFYKQTSATQYFIKFLCYGIIKLNINYFKNHLNLRELSEFQLIEFFLYKESTVEVSVFLILIWVTPKLSKCLMRVGRNIKYGPIFKNIVESFISLF